MNLKKSIGQRKINPKRKKSKDKSKLIMNIQFIRMVKMKKGNSHQLQNKK
jgi:hypothetical protein